MSASQDASQGGDNGKEGGQEGEESTQAAQHDLPAFDASNQEVVQQYESSYLGADGEPNLDSLSSVWLKSAKRDASGNITGALPDDVYKFLDARGYSKDLVKSVEAGQIALLQQSEQALYARAGGQANLQAAMEWGKKGGYTAAQRQRFNTIINGTDREAAAEQVERAEVLEDIGGRAYRLHGAIHPPHAVHPVLRPEHPRRVVPGVRALVLCR